MNRHFLLKGCNVVSQRILLIISLTICFNHVSAQINDSISSEFPFVEHSLLDDSTVSTHSLSLDLLGLSYSYEVPITKRSTIIVSAGLSYVFGRGYGIEMEKDYFGFVITTKDYHLLIGDLSVEPRFYYNLNKRFKKGKRVLGNSGGYLSANIGCGFPVVATNGINTKCVYNITPYWGFRRVWKHFLFDMAGGIGYLGTFDGDHGVIPTVRLILGYKF